MQPNEISLTVDVTNDGETTADETQVYTRFEEHLNRAVYISADHTVAAPNTLTFYRTPPKPNGNFPGMAKSAVKFSEAVLVDGVDGSSTVKSPSIVEISFSLPVGVTAAHAMELRQRAIALLDDDDIMDDLNMLLMV